MARRHPRPLLPRQPDADRLTMFILGVDLRQACDFTALAIIEERTPELHLRHLGRQPLGRSYVAMAERILQVQAAVPGCTLVVDATGVGRPVMDQLRARGLDPVGVSITGGRKTRMKDGLHQVPKREIVRGLLTALEGGRLKVARGLPIVDVLLGELADFKVTVYHRGHDGYGAATLHDDTVVAVGLAVWWSGFR